MTPDRLVRAPTLSAGGISGEVRDGEIRVNFVTGQLAAGHRRLSTALLVLAVIVACDGIGLTVEGSK